MPPPRPQALASIERVRSFHHEALLYDGEDEFVEGTLPFVTGALAAGEPVLVVVGEDRSRPLQAALGGESSHVHFADMHELGRNPARIIPAWQEFLERHAPDGRPARGVAEPVWDGRSRAELAECERHERLLNLAFADGQDWRLLCPYDLGTLDGDVIDAARRSHPFMSQHRMCQRSDAFSALPESAGPFEGALPEPGVEPQQLTFTLEQLTTLRTCVSSWAADARLSAERTHNLALSVSELATNSVRHGGGSGVLRIWTEDETLICEVRDRGLIDDALAGRVRPSPDRLSGRGLWLVNQLCDLVQIRSCSAGSVVRVHMRLI